MGRHARRSPLHRLGTPGLVHCLELVGMVEALSACHRRRIATLVVPARHSRAAHRRQSPVKLVPALAPTAPPELTPALPAEIPTTAAA
ncbi:MAG TPA: hypothetical protein VF444_13195 [Pseudonocardiaceae bacterium]